MIKKRFIYILALFFLFVVQAVSAQDAFYEYLEGNGYDIINIENEGVRQYIDDYSYDVPQILSDYNYSIVTKYSKGVSSRPAGIVLKWQSTTPAEKISRVVVTVVETDVEQNESILDRKPKGKNVKLYYPSIDSKEYLLCNMIPYKFCYYKIEEVQHDGQKTTLKTGRFYTKGQVRMLRVDGMINVRDFGGWSSSFDTMVEYGRLFRGNRPDRITATGKNDFVKNEHITADLDLRGKDLGESPLGPPNEVEYYYTNNQRYKLALTSNTQVLAEDLNIIASVLRKGGNLFLHCNHGTNRAGTLSFLIEGILGLSEADLNRDYELSSFAYGISRGQRFGSMFPVIRSYGKPGDDLAQCFYNFALSIGVTEETLDTLRCVMLGLPPDDPLILKAHRR